MHARACVPPHHTMGKRMAQQHTMSTRWNTSRHVNHSLLLGLSSSVMMMAMLANTCARHQQRGRLALHAWHAHATVRRTPFGLMPRGCWASASMHPCMHAPLARHGPCQRAHACVRRELGTLPAAG